MVKRLLVFCDRLHWLWLALAVPFMLFPPPICNLAMLVVPGLFMLRWLALRGKQQKAPGGAQAETYHRPSAIPRTPLNGTMLLMMLMILVSLWATYDVSVSLPAISGTVLGLGVYYAFVRLGHKSRGWWMSLIFFLIAIVGLAVVGLFGIRWGAITKIGFISPIILQTPPLLIGFPGVDNGLNPNEVAGALVWALPLMMTISVALFFLQQPQKRENANVLRKDWQKKIPEWRLVGVRILSLAATFFIGAVFLLCQSRAGYIAMALTLFALMLIALPPRWRWYSLAILVLLAIILGILLGLRWEAVRVWITGSDMGTDPSNYLNSLEGRMEIWSRALYGIQDFPFTGMGMNAFRKVVMVLYPLFQADTEIDIGHAHNEFLQVALDLGIPGLIAFIALYLGAFWMLLQIWRDQSLQNLPVTGMISNRWLVVGLGSGLLAHMLYSLTDAIPLGSKYGLLFWMLLGLVAALYEQVCSKRY